MDLEPARAEEIAAACAELRARGDFPAAIARGLEAGDPDRMRAAVTYLIEAGRVEGVRELVERFRHTRDFGVWTRMTSSILHRAGGEFAAALADIDDAMAHFPARAGAHWWVAKARCLEGLARGEEAAAAVREGMARFPDVALPQVFLANLLSRLGRSEEALDLWRDAFARFAEPELNWFVGLSNVLRDLGRRHEAHAALEDAARRFPDNPAAPPLLAEVAEERHQWARALEIWDDFAARFGSAAKSRAAVGRARALFRLDRVDEAVEVLETFLARAPDDIPALREQAWMAAELGETARARDLLIGLTQCFADKSRPEWWASLARAHHDLREYSAGAEALAELERRFPESALAEGERLRLAKELEYGQSELSNRIVEALRRFPGDFNLRSHWVWILLSFGRLEEAEREVQALEAEEGLGFALAARLRLEAERGDQNLRAYVERFAEGREWSLHEAIQIAYALHDVRAPWAFALGGEIVDKLVKRFAGNLRLNHLRIRLMIARREDAAALALIDAIPLRFVRREFLELRAWAAAKRARHDEAKDLWRQALAANYYAAVDAPIHTLNRVSPDDRPGPEVGVTAYVVFRNEAAQIPGFLAHHRRLGVKRFVFFDHLSSDGGRAAALREPDVIVYDCPDSYQLAWSGRRWVNEIVAREGAKGWGLQLDMDEYLVYPGCETVRIDRLAAYLDAHGYEAMRGYMLDVFPRRLIGENGEPAPFSDYRYYDDDYFPIGLERPPYLHPNGGVRARLFEAKEFLHKTPMWRLDAGKLINSHETTHLKFADVSATLLHYKLMNVALRGREAGAQRAGAGFLEADADVEAIRRHARYAARLERLWRADLVKPGLSRELADSLTLAERGLMDVSRDYREWVALA
jgi:predicted Zn-dependent protease